MFFYFFCVLCLCAALFGNKYNTVVKCMNIPFFLLNMSVMIFWKISTCSEAQSVL